jgi:ABC-type Fe3+/spermidine/putrescine transport system ATPase subunit
MLRVKQISKDLTDFSLRDVSFTVEDGDYFVLLGSSGVGKTVVLELLAGLVTPDAGHIFWDDEDITEQRIQHRHMGLVYQDQALFPHMTVQQNIAYGLKTRDVDRVLQLADSVSVSHLLHRYPGTLSGGEAQRVALARTLATEPRCLLLDEPLSALDAQSRSDLQALLRSLHREGHTVIHVTHEYKEAMALATHIAIMEDGTVSQIGTPSDVFHNPQSEFVARFVGFHNCFSGRIEHTDCASARFIAHGAPFEASVELHTESHASSGFLAFRSEDVSVSHIRDENSQNCYCGTVVDIAPARLGSELTVDIGLAVTALVPVESMERLDIRRGMDVWVSIQPSAARYIEK